MFMSPCCMLMLHVHVLHDQAAWHVGWMCQRNMNMNIKMKINVKNENERMTQTWTWIQTWTRTWTRTWIIGYRHGLWKWKRTWTWMWSSYISHTFNMSHWSSGLTICFPPQGAMVRAPRGATHTLELGLPVSAVSLQWSPRHDPWSPAMICPLTLATGFFSHPSCPRSPSHYRPQLNATYR